MFERKSVPLTKLTTKCHCIAAVGGIALAVVSGCDRRRQAKEHPHEGDALAGAVQVRRVATSVVQLLASPEKYDGTEARLAGFLVMDRPDREQGFLYLHKEDAERWLGTDVEVSFGRCDDKSPLDPLIPVEQAFHSNKKYVSLVGRFIASQNSPTSVGVVCDITILSESPEPGVAKEESPAAAGRSAKRQPLK